MDSPKIGGGSFNDVRIHSFTCSGSLLFKPITVNL